jgi:hypothetical protein
MGAEGREKWRRVEVFASADRLFLKRRGARAVRVLTKVEAKKAQAAPGDRAKRFENGFSSRTRFISGPVYLLAMIMSSTLFVLVMG